MRLTLQLEGETRSTDAEPGEGLADAAARAGVVLDLACGGRGRCGRCQVFLAEGELVTLEGGRLAPSAGRPLRACRHRVSDGDATIRVPARSLLPVEGAWLDEFEGTDHAPSPTVRIEPAGARWEQRALTESGWRLQAVHDLPPPPPLGLAVDLGTTTVAAALLDLASGRVLARGGGYNRQLRLAADVAGRIALCADPRKVDEQRRLVVEETLGEIVPPLCARAGAAPGRIARLAFAGNTTMLHLLAGLSPLPMGTAPFLPAALVHPPRPAADYGLAAGPAALADLLPSASAYLGADVVAGAHACRLTGGAEPALFLDIGTNGEILLWNDGRLTGCATAAGPAFEGAGLACGCRALPGAIDHLAVNGDGDWALSVLGGREAGGLCGSAIVDFLAAGRRAGWLNGMGRLDLERCRRFGRHLAVPGGAHPVHACRLAGGGSAPAVYLSEADIAEALKAKAALQAGIATLLELAGLRAGDLCRVVVAGGFGRFLDLENACAIGLLPDTPRDRIEWAGNGSLAGACLALLDEDALPAMTRLAGRIEPVELNRVPTFEARYIESLGLPGEDPRPRGPGRP